MKRIAMIATVLSSVVMPVAASNAAPVAATHKESVGYPVIVDTADGPSEGILCFVQGGRL